MGDLVPCAAVPADGNAEPPDIIGPLRLSLGHRYGDPDRWTIDLISLRGARGHERRLFRAHDPASGRAFAVKANSVPESNKRQFDALCNLRRQIPDCVSPLYLADDCRFFVMDWISAPLLGDRLAGPDRKTGLIHAGEWLRRLHAATSGRPPGSKLHIVRRPAEGDDDLVRMASTRLQARMHRTSARSGPVAMLHGDFHPGNLFIADGRLLAFDRKYDRHGITFYDVARFLVSVAYSRNAAVDAGQSWSGDAETDRRHFFEGYGALGEEDLALFDVVEDRVLFSRWQRLRQRGDTLLEEQMRLRSLLGSRKETARPGRLVAGARGGERWMQEPAPEIRRRGLMSRLRGAWLERRS